jgi:8-oxo-dGTP diphosphatase
MERPKVGVGVFVLKDGKFLIGKRKNAHGEGTWSLPGGHLEFNESWEECAKREVMEEVGVKIKNLRFADATNDIFTKEKKHYITLFIVSHYDSGEVKLMEPEKCEEWKWVSWQELPKPLFLPMENLVKKDFHPLD